MVIKVELEALKKAGTWGVIERPRRRNIVVCKWVLHIKKDVTNSLIAYRPEYSVFEEPVPTSEQAAEMHHIPYCKAVDLLLYLTVATCHTS